MRKGVSQDNKEAYAWISLRELGPASLEEAKDLSKQY